MATAGEAASLFGSSDTASDPFAQASGENEPDTQTSATRDEFSAGQGPQDATDLFGSSVDQTAFFTSSSHSDGVATYTQNGSQWSNGSTHQAATYGSSVAPAANEGYGGYSSQPATSGRSGQKWSGYESQSYSSQANGTYGGYNQAVPTQSYDPYAPYSPPAAPASQGTSSYALYSASSAYGTAQQSHAVTQSAYDPYKPAQTASTASPVPPQYPAYSVVSEPAPVPMPQVPTVPAVPATAPKRSTTPAAAYRPKTSNAYDPPLPPPKAAPRRGSAWSHTPTQYGFQAPTAPLGAGQPVVPPSRGATASLPPPPRTSSSSVPPPPARVASAMRQYASPPPSAPYYQQSMQQPADPYASPPRPPPPRLDDAFIPPPELSATTEPFVHNQQAQPYGDVGGDPYAPTSQWLNRAQSPGVQYDGMPPPSHDAPGRDVTGDARLAYGDSPLSTQAAGLLHIESSGADAHPPWETTQLKLPPVSPFASASVTSPPKAYASTAPAHDDTVYPESSWDGALVQNAAQNYACAPEERVTSVPISPKSQTSQRISSPVSSKGSISSPVAAVYDPYKPNGLPTQPPSRTLSPVRARSPGSSSVKSSASLKRSSLDQNRGAIASPPPPRPVQQRPPSAASQRSLAGAFEPPASILQHVGATHRTASPSSFSVRSVHSTQSVQSVRSVGSTRRDSAPYDPYAPSSASNGASTLRERSTSNSSVYDTIPEDPYAPSKHPSRQQTYDASAYSSFSAMSPSTDHVAAALPIPPSQIALVPPTAAPYAPSPSLLGTNDPLGRTSVRIPVVSFGFGGKLVTCFHSSSMLDAAMSSRPSTDIHIRPLHKVIPQSALDTSAASYPGPLFSDPGTPSTTLVRTGATAQTKTKKARVIKYLEERSEEISRGLGYLHHGSLEGYRAEAKHILINLLKVLVENDGRLSGSPQIDTAVRAALLPGFDVTADQSAESFKTPALGFPHNGDAASHPNNADDATVAVHTVRTSNLDKIQHLLLRGDRHGAYQYAADEKLWAHAMVIASSIDKEAWKEVVNEFVRSELTSKGSGVLEGTIGPTVETKLIATGREPLRVAYSLFAGHGPASVSELMPPKPLTSLAQLSAIPVPTAAITPMTASFPPSFQPSICPADILAKWAETAAMIISSPLTSEASSALTALGDQLNANQWVEAAHACYLLSPQTSPVGGVGMPSVRVILYGAPSPHSKPNFWKDPDPLIFSEIVEFALSLVPPTKGQEPFVGLPHLQPYRLVRAMSLAELGHVQLATRYCEAISASLTRSSPYLTAAFAEQLRSLTDRLTAAPVVDKSGSWIGSKMAKPSLDKIGNWLEGRFTSFIAGEDESPKHEETHKKEPSFSGPFAHYSTISSATPSLEPSPHMSTTNLNGMTSASLPTRTGSAMALRPMSASNGQITRASSAIDYLRRKPSPVPRVSSASATAPTFSDSSSASSMQAYTPNGYAPVPEATPRIERPSRLTDVSVEEEDSPETPAGPQMGSWWGSSEADVPTPTASSFEHSESLANPSSDGFISLMDVPTFSTSTSVSRTPSSQQYEDVDDDELGLGNSAFNKTPVGTTPNEPAAQAENSIVHTELAKEKEEEKPPSSGGWLSRLWKRSDSTGSTAPVKANLGDESSFYYDKELKRWVNKNAPPEASKPAAPPPPPRAQTVSPATHPPTGSPHLPSPGPPPIRPASAADLGNGPPKKPPMRVRSNLVPSDIASAPTTPMSARLPPTSAGPPLPSAGPTRPSSTAMEPPVMDGPPSAGARSRSHVKRNARSRYVDVFQQETASN